MALSYANAKLSIGKKRGQDSNLKAREDFSSSTSDTGDSRGSSMMNLGILKGEHLKSAKGSGMGRIGPNSVWATTKRLDFNSDVEAGEISKPITDDISLGQGVVYPTEITGLMVDLIMEKDPRCKIINQARVLNNIAPSEVFSVDKDPIISVGSQEDRDIIQVAIEGGEERISSVVTPAKRTKNIRGGTRKHPSKCHSMITRHSKMGIENSSQENVGAEEGGIIRTWNLAEEMTKVIEKGVALGVISNSNYDEETEKEGISNLGHFKAQVSLLKAQVYEIPARPISLIGSMYKILAKVLANRLKLVMDSVIREFQMAFVKNRQILDSFVIAEEIIHMWKKDNKGGLLVKLDFEKAIIVLIMVFWIQ
ncbi:hypothetical protein LWI28_012562 [Acer negundo]|uniref:Reverse transcriptase domain-containing protein n=1 Tax=Acer negundo TaxID=4023 RepID=A0AAD5I6G5_ACENE|nr:hypothetical protein LWI28_012562 [Acer negundo]